MKGLASGKQSFVHSTNIVQRNAFRGHSTKYECLENFALYSSTYMSCILTDSLSPSPCYSDVTDMQQWIGAINKASALYSSAPLPAPMSSSATFSRPTFPLAPTKNTIDQQVRV